MQHITLHALFSNFVFEKDELLYKHNRAPVLCNARSIYYFPDSVVGQRILIEPFLQWMHENPGTNPNLYPDYEKLHKHIYDLNTVPTGATGKLRYRTGRSEAMQSMFNKLLDEYAERDGEAKPEHATEAIERVSASAGINPKHASRHMDTKSFAKNLRLDSAADKEAQRRAEKAAKAETKKAEKEAKKAELAATLAAKPEIKYLQNAINLARVNANDKGIASTFTISSLLINAGITDINDPTTYPTRCPVLHVPLKYEKQDKLTSTSPVHFGYPLDAARVWRTDTAQPLTSDNINIVSHAAYVILDGAKPSKQTKRSIVQWIKENAK